MRAFILFLLLSIGFTAHGAIQVVVSIAPQKFLVQRIGQEHVAVQVIVPEGASSHTYAPKPKQMLSTQKSEVWFRIGEIFEQQMLPCLKGTEIVDQREGVELISSKGCCCHEADDPHIWLSPRLLMIQSQQIADTLSARDPEHIKLYQENLQALLAELKILDQELSEMFGKSNRQVIMVSHPAFGYFCRDYGLEQLSIEMEGREPSPKYLTELLNRARREKIETVFLQKQHYPKGGKRVAKELGAKAVFVDPYAEDVIENLRALAKAFLEA